MAKGKERIMLKPNLVAEGPAFTTKPVVVRTLVRMMKRAGKDVSIGEGSAAAGGFNALGGEVSGNETHGGINLLGGIIFEVGRLNPFLEARFELGGGEQFVATVGLRL